MDSTTRTAVRGFSKYGDVDIEVGKGATVVGAGTPVEYGLAGYYGDGISLYAYEGKATVHNSGAISTNGDGFAIHFVDMSGENPAYKGTASIENMGTITGAVLLGAGNDEFHNGGTFVATKDSDFGGGNDLFINTGTVSVRPGGAAAKAPGAVTFLGLERFENQGGTVDLRNGIAGDTLTLPGTYVGSKNATLGLDIAAGGKADMLVVGGIASGTTNIVLNATAANATLLSAPVTLVKAGAGTKADAFTILGQDIGFVSYGLAFDTPANAFTLTTRAGNAVRRLNQVTQGAQAIWQQQSDGWSTHMANLRDIENPGTRLWGQISGKVDTRHARSEGANLGYRQGYYAIQAGADLGGTRSDTGGLLFGLTGSYVSSHLNLRGGAERMRFNTLGLGGYAAFQTGPVFANLLGQYNHYSINAQDKALQWNDGFNGNGYGATGELGARLGGDRFFAEPVAALSWQHSDIGALHALGQTVSFAKGTALDGKLGARIGGTAKLSPTATANFYARGAYVHRFSGKGIATLESGGTSDSVSGVKVGDYGQAALGLNIATGAHVSGFIEANADLGNTYKAAGGRAGISFKF